MSCHLVTFDGVCLGRYPNRAAATRALATIQANCAAINGRGCRAPIEIEESVTKPVKRKRRK
jgi:hypothetical protein